MKRSQAVAVLRKDPQGLPSMFQGLSSRFEVRPLFLPREDLDADYEDGRMVKDQGKLYVFFRPEFSARPNAMVRITWKQTLAYLRRTYPR